MPLITLAAPISSPTPVSIQLFSKLIFLYIYYLLLFSEIKRKRPLKIARKHAYYGWHYISFNNIRNKRWNKFENSHRTSKDKTKFAHLSAWFASLKVCDQLKEPPSEIISLMLLIMLAPGWCGSQPLEIRFASFKESNSTINCL